MSLIILAFMTAALSVAIKWFSGPGMIFSKFDEWLAFLPVKNNWMTLPEDKMTDDTPEYGPRFRYNKPVERLVYFLRCPYCYGTWIGVVYYYIHFPLSFDIFLFIGVNWVFTRSIMKLLFYQNVEL